jgi:hypothetical protein
VKKQVGLVILVLALATQFTRAADSKAEARSRSEQWLALVDGGNYAGSWTEASRLFQSKITQKQWAGMVEGVRTPLGPLASDRSLISITFRKSLPGVPDGNYAVIQFRSAFKNKAQAVETVSLMLEDGKWKVAGYFIK